MASTDERERSESGHRVRTASGNWAALTGAEQDGSSLQAKWQEKAQEAVIQAEQEKLPPDMKSTVSEGPKKPAKKVDIDEHIVFRDQGLAALLSEYKVPQRQPKDGEKPTLQVHGIVIEGLASQSIEPIRTELARKRNETSVNKKIIKNGRNELTPPPVTPGWKKFLHHLVGGFSTLLWIGGILCFVAYGMTVHDTAEGDDVPVDNLALGIVLVGVVIVTAVFSYYQEAKSDAVMAGFAKLEPSTCGILRDGVMEEKPANDLVPGDICKMVGGKKTPADILILKCQTLKVNNSNLTGEPEPLGRAEKTTHDMYNETKNLVFFGTDVVEGEGIGLVIRTGDDTALGQIANETNDGENPPTLMQIEIGKFIFKISSIAVLIGVTFFFIAVFATPMNFFAVIVLVIGIIVANVPEGLLVTMTVALTISAQKMAEKNVHVKNVETVETLGAVSCICSDKTGTLTENRMTAYHMMTGRKIFSLHHLATDADHLVKDITKKKQPDLKTVAEGGAPEANFWALLRASVLNNDCKFASEEKLVEKLLDFQCVVDPYEINEYKGNNGHPMTAEQARKLLEEKNVPGLEAPDLQADYDPLKVKNAKAGQQPEKGVPSRPLKVFSYEGEDSTSLKKEDAKVWDPVVDILSMKMDGNPTEAGFLKLAQPFRSVYTWRNDCKRLAAIPFNSTNKWMLTVNRLDKDSNKAILTLKGAPETILALSEQYMDKNGDIQKKTAEDEKEFDRLQGELAEKGERVIGFAQLEFDESKYPASYKFNPDAEQGEEGSFPTPLQVPRGPKNEILEPMQGLTFLGFLSLMDPPRSAVGSHIADDGSYQKGAVANCHSAHIQVVMVTGDQPKTAQAISEKIGILQRCVCTTEKLKQENRLYCGAIVTEKIVEEKGEDGKIRKVKKQGRFRNTDTCLTSGMTLAYTHKDKCEEVGCPSEGEGCTVNKNDPDINALVVRGPELIGFRDEDWAFACNHCTQVVFARTLPAQKKQIVGHFQNFGHVVAVTGDGVNDSPALKKADVGIAMGIAGSEVAKNAADMILVDDNFASIVDGVQEGRIIFDNLKKSIAYTLSSNIPEITPFLFFILLGLPLPLETVMILCIDLGTDMWPAISLAYERAERDIMQRRPRNKFTDALVTVKLICFAYAQIGVIQAIAGFVAYVFTFRYWMNKYFDDQFEPSDLVLGIGNGAKWADDDWACLNYIPMQGPMVDNEYSLGIDVSDIIQAALSASATAGATSLSWSSFNATQKEKAEKQMAATQLDGATLYERLGKIDGEEEASMCFRAPQHLWACSAPPYGTAPTAPVTYKQCDHKNPHYTADEWVNVLDGETTSLKDQFEQGGWSKELEKKLAEAIHYSGRHPGSYGYTYRMQANRKAQTMFLLSIIMVQWADLLICKTRMLSIFQQGMSNWVLNTGLLEETILGLILAYVPFLQVAFTTSNLDAVNFLYPLPFVFVIWVYDETRKYILRNNIGGVVYRYTYY
jgi:sodium/potassium-transporting ATPase subunit alpha